MAEFLQEEIIFGAEGLDFQRTLDQVPPNRFSIATNVIQDRQGRVTHRPGETSYVTGIGTTPVHTIVRLENPKAGDILLIGAGTQVATAPATGGPATPAVDPAYSGNPLSVLIGHTALTGEPWAFIADTEKMRKIKADGPLVLPIGLAKAGVLAAAVASQGTIAIDTFDNNGAWTNNAGTGGAPTNAFDAADFKQGTHSLKLTSAVGAATAGYYNFWSKANGVNLDSIPGSRVGARGGPPVIVPKPGTKGEPTRPPNTPPRPTRPPEPGSIIQERRVFTDEDHFHLWVKTDRPDKMLEFRIYYVLNSTFTTNVVPGTSATLNTDAYVKILRPSDFTSSTELSVGATTQAQLANLVQQIIDQLPQVVDGRLSVADIKAQIERARAASQQLAAGRGSWTEYGVVGRTLQRGEFRRIGSDATRTWANVTGIILVLQTVDNTTGVNVWLDDLYFFGGSGPDSSQPTAVSYDWRAINYDPRTACRSLPSDEFTTTQKLDLIRRSATLTPTPFGDAAVHQRFYRRGGTLGSDWHYLGENTSDGGAFTDDLSDLEIVAADTLNLDDDAPVTTSDSSGNTLYQQPLSSIFGPIGDILFGCGDKYHRGRLYWSKPTEFEHWPAANYVDVCPDGEELLCGFRLGGQGFVFSRERLYAVYPNLSDARVVSVQPTSCQSAPVERWCIAVGFGICFFIERDGIYATNGGPEQNITDQWLRPLFMGQDVGTPVLLRRPIDFSATQYLRLFVVGDYLWFLYKDLGGNFHGLRYNVVLKYWEGFFDFSPVVASIYDDVIEQKTLMGIVAAVDQIVEFTGATDLGNPITCQFFTGALNQGAPRQKKQYGDAYIDFQGNLTSLTVTPYRDNFSAALAASVFTGTSDRARYYADFTDVIAYDLGLRVQWTVPANSTPVYVHKGGISYLPQPDEAEQRVTDWDAGGRLTDKWIKGVVIECDTQGVDKSVQVQVDGVTQTTLTVNASGRQVLEFSFAQFRGRLIRLRPTDDVKWILYKYSWIFDEEPLSLTRWETQELALGAVGWKTPHFAHVTLLSNATVTLTLTAYREDGTSVAKSYSIPSTGGVKQTRYVQMEAQKGVLYKIVSTSPAPHYIYREETIIMIHNWTTGQDYEVKIFGTDDLDLVRASQNAALTAARAGGG